MTTQNSTRLDMLTTQFDILSSLIHQREMDDSRSIQRLNDRIGELEHKVTSDTYILEDKVRDLENKLSDLERR